MSLMKSKNKLEKGDKAPHFSLRGADNQIHSLDKIKGEKATLIIFMCNHCPYVQAKLPELNRIHNDFKDKGVKVIGINSNESENYPDDSFENMQLFAKQGRVKFTYLHDETQEVAKTYDAVCTPDPFLFDGNLKLIFHSRIDDAPGQPPSNNHELYTAILEFINKGKISLKEIPSIGCSIKWK